MIIYILFFILYFRYLHNILIETIYLILINFFHSYYVIDQLHLIRQYLQSSVCQKYIKICKNISACFLSSLLDSDLSVCHYCRFLGVRTIKKSTLMIADLPCLNACTLLFNTSTNNSTSPTSFLQAMLYGNAKC